VIDARLCRVADSGGAGALYGHVYAAFDPLHSVLSQGIVIGVLASPDDRGRAEKLPRDFRGR